jgi:protein involved in polysaccharide export with SLBB domain
LNPQSQTAFGIRREQDQAAPVRHSSGWLLFSKAVGAVVISHGLLACASSPAPVPTAGPDAVPASAAPLMSAVPSYRVGAGDELNFRFTHLPELNTVAQVRADGTVSLPLLGQVKVAGHSLAEVSAQVQSALSTRVRRPEVFINVQGNLPSQRVFVGGEVTKPGVQSLAGGLTVLQAVMSADGLKDTAQPRQVTVVRRDAAGQSTVFRLDLEAVMAGRAGVSDLQLMPYDVVIVPRSGIANVGLWVDQYIRRVLPISLGFSYSLGRNSSLQ